MTKEVDEATLSQSYIKIITDCHYMTRYKSLATHMHIAFLATPPHSTLGLTRKFLGLRGSHTRDPSKYYAHTVIRYIHTTRHQAIGRLCALLLILS